MARCQRIDFLSSTTVVLSGCADYAGGFFQALSTCTVDALLGSGPEILLHRRPSHRRQMFRNRRVQVGAILQAHR